MIAGLFFSIICFVFSIIFKILNFFGLWPLVIFYIVCSEVSITTESQEIICAVVLAGCLIYSAITTLRHLGVFAIIQLICDKIEEWKMYR